MQIKAHEKSSEVRSRVDENKMSPFCVLYSSSFKKNKKIGRLYINFGLCDLMIYFFKLITKLNKKRNY